MPVLEALLAALGFAAAPKIFKDLREIYYATEAAVERYRDAKDLYESLIADVITCEIHVLRMLGVIAKIGDDLTSKEKEIVNKMLEKIHSKLQSLKEWTEKNKIKQNEKNPQKLIKKLRAGFGRRLRNATRAVDDMYEKMKQIDIRVAMIYRELQLDVELENQEKLNHLEDRQIRMEESMENYMQLILARLDAVYLQTREAHPPGYDEAMKDPLGLSDRDSILSDVDGQSIGSAYPESTYSYAQEKKERNQAKWNYSSRNEGNNRNGGNGAQDQESGPWMKGAILAGAFAWAVWKVVSKAKGVGV